MPGWEANVRRVSPYTPGEQPKQKNVIKLNTNENPYPPSPLVRAALQEKLDIGSLRKYPDPACSILNEALAASYGLDVSQVFSGVGSDDVLAMCFMTFFYSKAPIVFPDITYSFYDVWADEFRIPYRIIPLDENFLIRAEDYTGFAPGEIGGIVIANPNAPTGEILPFEDIERIVRSNPDVVVIVDEAYVDFGAASALPLIDRYDNVLVVQTFSKSRSLAGMRIGYAFGCEKLISYLQDIKYSYNSYTMTTPSLLAGVAALDDPEYFRQTSQAVMATREWSKQALRALGFKLGDSMSNFVFATHPRMEAARLFAALKEKNIYVRYFRLPRIDNYLRISIGTDQEMEKLIEALKEILET